MSPAFIGVSAALMSAFSWAVGSILFKNLGETLSPLAMTLVKGTVSVLLMTVILCITGFSGIAAEPLVLLMVSGIIGIAIADSLFFEALQDLGPHALAVLMVLGMVVTPLFASLFLGEAQTWLVWAGIALVIVGIAIVLYNKLGGDEQTSSPRGVLFGVLSVLCMSISMIIAKKGLETISAMQASFIRMLAGTVGMFLLGLSTRRLGKWITPFTEPKMLVSFILAVCVVTFGGFWLSLVSIKYLDVSIAYTLNSTEPIFILPLAAIFLKEKVTLQKVAGTLIAILGIACLLHN